VCCSVCCVCVAVCVACVLQFTQHTSDVTSVLQCVLHVCCSSHKWCDECVAVGVAVQTAHKWCDNCFNRTSCCICVKGTHTFIIEAVSAYFALLACFGMSFVGRLLQNIGLFSKRALLKRRYSAKETYNFKEPTNCSHPIDYKTFTTLWPNHFGLRIWDDPISWRIFGTALIYRNTYSQYRVVHGFDGMYSTKRWRHTYTHICRCVYTYMHI